MRKIKPWTSHNRKTTPDHTVVENEPIAPHFPEEWFWNEVLSDRARGRSPWIPYVAERQGGVWVTFITQGDLLAAFLLLGCCCPQVDFITSSLFSPRIFLLPSIIPAISSRILPAFPRPQCKTFSDSHPKSGHKLRKWEGGLVSETANSARRSDNQCRPTLRLGRTQTTIFLICHQSAVCHLIDPY